MRGRARREASAGRGCAATRARSASRPPVTAPGCPRLDEHVAQGGRLDRAGDHRRARSGRRSPGRAGGSGRRRRRRGRVPIVAAGQRARRCPGAAANACGEALHDAAHEGAASTGARPRRARRTRRDPGRHVARRQEARVLHVEDRHRRRSRRRPRPAARQSEVAVRSQVRSVSLSSHRPMTLVRKRMRAVDAALVGEVGRPGRLGEHRARRARRRPAPRSRRRCTPRRRSAIGTPTTADAVSCEPTATTAGWAAPIGSATSGSRLPIASPGRRARRRAARGRPSSAISSSSHCPVPRPSSPVVEALVRSVDLAARSASEPSRSGTSSSRSASVGPGVGGELVERVERQELQAVAGVELARAAPRRGPARRRRRPRARRGSGTACPSSRPSRSRP